jgi:hypothetical protein
MPVMKRKRQKTENEVEKAAHVPPTAINRLEISSRKRRPNLRQNVERERVGTEETSAINP